MYWLMAYARFVPRKGSNGSGYDKKVLRSHGMSAYHASRYREIRLPTIHSVNKFSAQPYATLGLYHFETLLTNNIDGS